MSTIPFACDCGALAGELHVSPRSGSHVACHCADCRATLVFHDRDWDQSTGTRVWHTTPDHVRVLKGADRLAAIKVTPKGFLRWYASCCGTPIGASTETKAIPFCGLHTDVLETTEPLGPIVAEAYVSAASPRHIRFGRLVSRVVLRALVARLAFRTGNPFLDGRGHPVGPVHVLSGSERAGLYA